MSILSYLRDALRANWKADCNSRVDAWADSVQARLNETKSCLYIDTSRVDKDKYCNSKPNMVLDFNPIPYWTAEDLLAAQEQSTLNKEHNKMTTVFDRSGKAHEALGFVICVDEGSTSLLTQGKVYANLDTSELQSPCNLVCRLLLEKKKKKKKKKTKKQKSETTIIKPQDTYIQLCA